MSALPRLCFVSGSAQNVFFEELLDAFRRAVDDAGGFQTETAIDHFPTASDDLVYVFVPHEYLPLTHTSAHPSPGQLARTIALCTEQPGTTWFEEAVKVALRCAAAVDINSLGRDALRWKGVDALLLPLGYVPSWDSWHGEELRERPIDVAFMGGVTERRCAAIAACGEVLTTRRAEFHLFDTSRPHTAGSEDFLSGRQKWDMLASTKILLNIHRSELGYLEWQRMVGAMANGCVVVTEHSVGIDPLVPGSHYVSASLEDFPFVIDALLCDHHRLFGIRHGAYEFLRERFRLSDSINVLTDTAHTVLRSAPRGLPTADGQPHPAPKSAPPRPTGYEQVLQRQGSEQQVLRMAVKRILLEQRDLQRALRRLEAVGADGAHDDVEVCRFGPRTSARPRVSVLVSVYNYREHVEEAMRSAGLSSLRDLELIVVDDASTDDSVNVATRTFEAMPWLDGTLLHRRHNAGLPSARNLAADYARGEYLFILDADNAVYPHAFERLAGALDAAPDAAFAYGLLEERRGGRLAGLMSWPAWDPRTLRYGNFIDAMSLVRRSFLLQVGGFATDPRLFGWEDFALWCSFAERGWRGVRVPEILGRYRILGQSMIAVTNIDDSDVWTALARRHPFLIEGADEPVARSASRIGAVSSASS
jgi:hypothetical protein